MRAFYHVCRIVVFILLLQVLATDAFILYWYGWPLASGGLNGLDQRISWTNAVFGFPFRANHDFHLWLLARIAICLAATVFLFFARRFLIRKIESLTPPNPTLSPQSS
jgi:hypothetical protein